MPFDSMPRTAATLSVMPLAGTTAPGSPSTPTSPARAFGAPFVHENEFAGAAAHYLNSRGVVAVNPEVGGCYLGPQADAHYIRMMTNGLAGMLRHLGMIEGKPDIPCQIYFDTKARRELRPRVSGFLVSHFQNPDDLGKLIKGGTRLGEVIDLYSYEVIETIDAPFDGYLFFSRYSGMVGAGTHPGAGVPGVLMSAKALQSVVPHVH